VFACPRLRVGAADRRHSAADAQTFVDIIRGLFVIPFQRPEIVSPGNVFTSELAAIERIIGRVAAQHHLRDADAEDFASHVKMKLIENDYAIVRKFEGRSSCAPF